jgi:large subunit ribosomal protein LP0
LPNAWLTPFAGTVEIVNDVPLIKKGEKVGASEATLLNMLGISPFAYALIVQYVYDAGSLYEPHILDIKVCCVSPVECEACL